MALVRPQQPSVQRVVDRVYQQTGKEIISTYWRGSADDVINTGV